jgi:predicted PurR-regulated permease PerM
MDKKLTRSIILIAVLAVVGIALLIKLDSVLAFFAKILKLLIPIIIGIVIAFILNRPVMRINSLFKKLIPKLKDKPRNLLSIALAYVLLIGLITAIICFIVPPIKNSVMSFSENFDSYYSNFLKYYDKLSDNDTFGLMSKLSKALSELGSDIPKLIEKTYNVTSSIVAGITNTVIGFIISIYILLDKVHLRELVSSFLRSLLPEAKFKSVTKYYRLVSDTFSRFISGQITEAFILGGLCFLGMTIFGFEYAPLISMLIGVTALVPVVGAIIGTIPSVLVLLLVKPIDAVWFVVFIIILQQLENNLIYPRVVGKSIGLPPLLVLLAILIGAGLGGVVGILFGVPLMSVLYIIVKDYTASHIHEAEAAQNPAPENQ